MRVAATRVAVAALAKALTRGEERAQVGNEEHEERRKDREEGHGRRGCERKADMVGERRCDRNIWLGRMSRETGEGSCGEAEYRGVASH